MLCYVVVVFITSKAEATPTSAAAGRTEVCYQFSGQTQRQTSAWGKTHSCGTPTPHLLPEWSPPIHQLSNNINLAVLTLSELLRDHY